MKPYKAWQQIIATPNQDRAYSVATSNDESLYVVGDTFGSLDELDVSSNQFAGFIRKYKADGTKLSTKSPISTTTTQSGVKSTATSVATTKDNSVYVAGYFYGQNSLGSSDFYVAKYSSDNTKLWTSLLGTPEQDNAFSIATGADGSVFVAGSTSGSLDGQINKGNSDAFVVKYNGDGSKAWTRLLGTTESEVATSVAISSDGSCYVTGYTYGRIDGNLNSGLADIFLAKYNKDGTKEWSKQLGSSSHDSANSIAVSSDGSIYIAGDTFGKLDGFANQGQDGFVTKYSSNGSKIWTRLISSSSSDHVGGITVADDGSVFVTGATSGNLDGQNPGYNSGEWDSFIIRYSSSGMKEWTYVPGDGSTLANSIAVSSDGSIYIAGDNYTYEQSTQGQGKKVNVDGFVAKIATNPSALSLGIGSSSISSSTSSILAPTISQLILTGLSNINGTGNALNNYICGNNANNVLDGGAGNDLLIGGKGNDTYVVGSVGDQIIEYLNEGIDTVLSTVSWTLGENLENLTLAGISGINGNGNDLNNTIIGNGGDNIINGGKGFDIMNGGAGNDTYYIDSSGDSIIDLSGVDTVFSSASWTLSANLERLYLTGSDPITGIGNSNNNTIVGNSANNTIDGKGGTDILTGGGGSDVFRFSTKPLFGASNASHITDFNNLQDRIQISKRAFGLSSSTNSLAVAHDATELANALITSNPFVYDISNGNLYFNQNGTKIGFGTGGVFVTIDNRPELVVPWVASLVDLV